MWESLSDRLHPEVEGTYVLKQCTGCGLIFIDPQPLAEKLSEHYPATYHVYQREPRPMGKWKKMVTKAVAEDFLGYGMARAWRRVFLAPFYFKLSHLPYFVRGGRVLDVGCGDGSRLLMFKELGWGPEGIEVNRELVEKLNSLGFDVRLGELDSLPLPLEYFDAVYLNNVFEHLRDPHLALEKIQGTLKPNGELVLVVPNQESVAFKAFSRNWFSLEIPRHLFLYNKRNLTLLLDQHGFRVVGTNYMHTLGSLTSSFAYTVGWRVDAFGVVERPVWVLNLILDPLFDRYGIGEWMVVRARKYRPDHRDS